MTADEKQQYVKAFLQPQFRDAFLCGEVLELLGILFKGAPYESRKMILLYIKENAILCIQNAASIISLCNCVRCVYNEINELERNELVEILNKIKDGNSFFFVNESIELTMKIMKGEAL